MKKKKASKNKGKRALWSRSDSNTLKPPPEALEAAKRSLDEMSDIHGYGDDEGLDITLPLF
eukprot:1250682-Amorphochlora_amoeboformis.AAC.1